MTRKTVVRSGGVAAVTAGACWVGKAASILLTGEQPPILFEAAFVLFPIALVGLYAAIPRHGSRLALGGLMLAIAALVSAVLVSLGVLLGPDAWVPREDSVTILTPLFAVAGLGTFAALLLLGLAVRRTKALPGRGHSLPIALAAFTLPLLVVGGALEAVNERLLEVPILVLGLAWIGLGLVLARATPVGDIPETSAASGGS